MRVFRLLFSAIPVAVSLFLVSSFVFVPVEAATENPAGLGSTPDITSLQLVNYQEGDADMVISFNLKNTALHRETYRLAVEFHSLAKESAAPSFIARVNETPVLGAAEGKDIRLQVPVPSFLSGQYAVFVGLSDQSGTIVAREVVSEHVSLAAQEHVVLDQCSVAGVPVTKNVNIAADHASDLSFQCQGRWTGKNSTTVTLVARLLDSRYAFPVELGRKDMTLSDTSETVAVPVTYSGAAGSYWLELGVLGADNREIGLPARALIKIQGVGGKILNITKQVSEEKEGEVPVTAVLNLYDDQEYRLSLVLSSDGEQCAEKVEVPVQSISLKEVQLPVEKACPHPTVMATLSTSGGQELDQFTMSSDVSRSEAPVSIEPAASGGFFSSLLKKLPWVALVVVVVLGGYFVFKKERMKRIAPMIVFFLFASTLLGFSARQAHAASVSLSLWCSVGPCSSASAVFVNVTTNKSIYAPGEPINVTVMVSSDDAPKASTCPVVRVNGGADLVPDCYTNMDLIAGQILSYPALLTAPLATGAFTASVSASSSGYSATSGTLFLSVASAATPTASLTFNTNSGTVNSTVFSGTLFSTDAQSCEIRYHDNSGVWVTYLDRNSNQTSANVSTTYPSPNTYTFETRCWSGPNGTGNVSAVDTDTLIVSAGPSASFTNIPNCTIPAGQPNCMTTIFWTSSNVSTASLTDCAGGLYTENFDPNFVTLWGVAVQPPTGCYQLHNGNRFGTVLATGSATAQCAAPETWDLANARCTGGGAVSGVCGAAQGKTYNLGNSIIPMSDRCSAGTYNGAAWNPDGGAWYTTTTFPANGAPYNTGGAQAAYYLGRFWSCDGSNGGTTSGCSLYYEPQCGSLNGQTLSSPPPNTTGNDKIALCQIGTASVVTTNPATYTWNCTNGAGPTAFCSANRPAAGPTATISASVVQYSLDHESFWEKLVSFVTGRDYVAQATGGPASISLTGTANLTWNASNVLSCSILGPTLSSTNFSGSQNVTGAALGVGTHTFNISCFGATGSVNDSAQVIVTSGSGVPGAPGGGGPGDFFSANPAACGTGTINIAWNSVSGATDYELERDGSIVSTGASTNNTHSGLGAGTNHSYRVRAHNASGYSSWTGPISAAAPSACGGYTIDASAGPGGSISPSGVFMVAAGSNQSFVITPNAGFSVAAVTVNGVAQGAVGSLNISNINQNYTIVASFVAVPSGPSVSLSLAPPSIVLGASSALSWSSAGGVTSCLGSGGGAGWNNTAQPANGSILVSPAITTTYSIECWDGGGTSTGVQSATLTVVAGGPTPTVLFTVSPNSVVLGSTATLTWNVSGAYPWSGCLAWGAPDWSGFVASLDGTWTKVVTPAVTTTYNIECFNAIGSSGVQSVTVTVSGAATGSISANPATCPIAAGQSNCITNLSWNIVGAGSPNMYSPTWNVTFSNSATAFNSPMSVSFGSYVFQVRDGVSVLGSTTVTGVCANGTAWVGGVCQVVCAPNNTCADHAAEVGNTCTGSNYHIANNGCGLSLDCPGTRSCDYNWKEVSP